MTLSYLFLFGLLSISVLNFVHIHRCLHPEKSFSGPSIMRGLASRSRRPPSIDSVKGKPPEISACLIVMDDNHFLIEWLAYHYHTANLRHLIITSDPHSRTSPSKILDRWKDRINIQEWNETNFLPSNFDEQVENKSFDEKNNKVLQNHRVRQANFNLECLKEFKRQKSGWTLLIDTDEYLIPREDPSKNLTKAVTPIVADILGALHIPAGFNKIYSPCIPINREQFSTRKSSDEKVQARVAPGFDGMDFQTMRWRNYGTSEMVWIDTKFDKACGIARDIPNKIMIDLGQVTLEELYSDKNTGNPHSPLDICDKNVFSKLKQTPFVLHHYMGTPEQWFYRSNDKRGVGFRGAKYDDMNERFGMKESDAIRPWLTDFVALIGNDEASRLLEGVGKLEPLPGSGSKANIKRDNSNNTYEVGDLVAVNFAGEGKWYEGEIYSSYSNNFYSVFFEDCSQEIATFADRMLPINKSVLAASFLPANSEPTE